jgi:hypothetical protein
MKSVGGRCHKVDSKATERVANSIKMTKKTLHIKESWAIIGERDFLESIHQNRGNRLKEA